MSGLVVVDHGAGNLPNLVRALEHLGQTPRVSGDPNVVLSADRLILPGVGAFGDCMAELKRSGLITALLAFRERERPLLGICVGMQVLFSESEEFGPVSGLDWLPGRVVRLQRTAERKVPNMGWCPVHLLRSHPVLASAGRGPYFYFVHSYHAQCQAPEDVLAIVRPDANEEPITAAVAKNALIAVQFHPEKSSESGLKLLEAFCHWTP